MKNLNDYIQNIEDNSELTTESLADIKKNIHDFIENGNVLQNIQSKSKDLIKKSGKSILINILILYYILVDKNTDIKDKLIIMSTLVYFILPTDTIFDASALGFADDIALITYTLNILKNYTSNEKYKRLAEIQYNKWFSKDSIKELKENNK